MDIITNGYLFLLIKVIIWLFYPKLIYYMSFAAASAL
ncbi:protein of unknown function, might belong to type II secretion system protein [Shewanella benthica]|uniref:Uncharacterized protein n=1 Tax=Shewanella benthica TaxID=43661 RepID=A0A330M3H0_9GAMM|nr:protein of unknown function, might belong to type II secretion system protein [Shewanella benthica]